MKKKLMISMSVVVLIALVLTSIITLGIFYNNDVQSAKMRLEAESEYLKTIYTFDKFNFVENLNTTNVGRITLIDKDGYVLFDNQGDEKEMENHSNRPEIIAANKDGEAYSSRMSDTMGEVTYYYATKLEDDCILRIALTVDSIYQEFFNALPWFVLGIIIVCSVVIFIVRILAKKIVDPLNNINLSNPVPSNVYEELFPLVSKIDAQEQSLEKSSLELSQNRNEFNAVISNMQEGLLILDNDYNVLSMNRNAVEIFGKKKNFVLGDSVFIFNRSLKFIECLKKASRGLSSSYNVEFSSKICEVIVSPIISDNHTSGIVVIIIDISETQNREKMRREFTANVSHELKTPLTSISGYSEIIKSGIAKSEDIVNFADKIHTEAQRLISLVADIIKLSELEEKDFVNKKTECSLLDISKTIAQRLELVAKNNNVTIEVVGSDVKFAGYEKLLYDMIRNLCDNAIRYNKENGTVTVSIIDLGETVKLSVSDTGIGIPKEDTGRIFERFYRVDKSHSKETGGTGLGLSIVKHSARVHNATINVTSKLDVGTTIECLFPKNN